MRCNYRRDCPDGSDEQNCKCNTNAQLGGLFFQCPKGGKYLQNECLYKSYQNDYYPDCNDEEILGEESDVEFRTYMDYWKLDTDSGMRIFIGSARSIMKKCFEEGKVHQLAPCSNNIVPHGCFEINEACILKINPAGHFDGCRSGTHLQRCNAFQCPMMFKCPGSFCVNLTQVCDGVGIQIMYIIVFIKR